MTFTMLKGFTTAAEKKKDKKETKERKRGVCNAE